MPKKQSEAHWSKDYIEHLRSIHFFLILAAVTGIVFGLTPTKAERETAQHQLRMILGFIGRQQQDIDDALKHSTDPRDGQFLTIVAGPERYFLDMPEVIVLLPICDPGSRGNRNLGSTETGSVSFNTWRDGFVDMVNLDSFITKWNSTHCGVEGGVFYIESVRGGAWGTSIGDIPLAKFAGNSSTLLQRNYKFARISMSLPQPDMGKYINEIDEPDIHTDNVTDKRDVLFTLDVDETRFNIFAQGTYQQEPTAAGAFGNHFYVEDISDISTVMKGPKFDCYGDFKSCFPELYRATQDKQSWSLKDVTEAVDGEVANAEKQFELGGIKFPSEDISAGGIILMITVLAYFCLHLRELSPKIKSTDSGLEVAWLGLYSSWFAYALMWSSILLVPVYSVALLGVKASQYDGVLRHVRYYSKPLFLWMFVPCLVTATLGVLSCLYARRLARLAAYAFEEDDAMPMPESTPALTIATQAKADYSSDGPRSE
jgi:hypothetical protein